MSITKQIISLLFAVVCFFSTQGQDSPVLKQKISIHTDKNSLDKVFSAIEIQANVSFAFQSDIINQNQPVTIHASNEPLSVLLDKILNPLQLKYTVIGTQIIIYKPRTQAVQNINQTYTDTIQMVIYDTIQVQDTNRHHIYDTTKVHIYDTVRVKRYVDPQKHKTKYYAIDCGLLFGNYPDREPEEPEGTTITKEESIIIKNYIGINIGIKSGNWSIETGIGYLNQQQSIDYSVLNSYIVTQTVYDSAQTVNIDTVGYFSIPGVDTTWNIRYDTSYNVTSREEENLKTESDDAYHRNTLSYIRIPVSIGFTKEINKNVAVISLLSLKTSILLNYNGYVLLDGENTGILKFSDVYPSPVIISGFFACGIQCNINKQLRCELLPLVQYQITPTFSDSSLKQYKSFDLGISLRLKKFF